LNKKIKNNKIARKEFPQMKNNGRSPRGKAASAAVLQSLTRKWHKIVNVPCFLYKNIVYRLSGTPWYGRLSPNLNDWEICADMTNYEKAMIVIAVLTLLIDALALFKNFL